MVSRAGAVTIATAGILAGLAAGVAALSTAAGEDVRDSAVYGALFAPGCLAVAVLWVFAGARNASLITAAGVYDGLETGWV